MGARISILACLLTALLAGCASVKSTSEFYLPYTTKVYPPKDPKAEIPILGKAPEQPYEKIGRLKFESDNGWKFMRRSMIYNAQVNGADAVILKEVKSRKWLTVNQIPPYVELVSMPSYYRDKKGRVYGYNQMVPIYRPGFTQQWINEITAIDAEMIVMRKSKAR